MYVQKLKEDHYAMRILIFYFILVSKRKGAFLKLRVIEKFTNVRLSSLPSLVIKKYVTVYASLIFIL